MEVFNTSKEPGPLWNHTREACQSPEEADTLSAAGQRAGGAESAGASLWHQTHTHTHSYTHMYSCTYIQYIAHIHTNSHDKEWFNVFLTACKYDIKKRSCVKYIITVALYLKSDKLPYSKFFSHMYSHSVTGEK